LNTNLLVSPSPCLLVYLLPRGSRHRFVASTNVTARQATRQPPLTIIFPRSYTSENDETFDDSYEKVQTMKSAHRHQLETNVLAHRLEMYIQRYRPYTATIIGVLFAIVALIFAWSYLSGSSAAKRNEAWDTYNRAVASSPPNIDDLHRTAQDYPGTPMQQMADVTWADAQVLIASYSYLNNRPAALEALGRATSAYQGVIQSSNDERLIGRARLGMARAYEMQNHLDKARDEYRQVKGTFTKYAQQQVERLEKPDAQEAYAWLATAQPPRPKAPVGPGTPGQRPEFSPGEISLPGANAPPVGKAPDATSKGGVDAMEELLKSIKEDPKKLQTPDRYKTDQQKPAGSTTTPAGKETAPNASKGVTPPANAEKSGDKPAEKTSSSDKSSK
jgi:tetratricopeptide (TPR) repeat protein